MRYTRGMHRKYTQGLWPLLFLLLAPLYVIHLGMLAFALHGDEANIALQALQLQSGQVDIIGVGWANLPLLSFLPHALTMAVFGANVVGQRMGSVIFGILSLPVFYYFVKLLFTKRVALFATLLLGVSNIWLAYSRVGLTNVQAAFVVLCTLYFTLLGIEKKKTWAIVVGGIFLGLCVYSYLAARITPLIILPYFFFSIYEGNEKKQVIRLLGIFLFSAVLTAMPQGFFYLAHGASFNSRASDVYIFSSAQSIKEWMAAQYAGQSAFSILVQQFLHTIQVFTGDNAGQYGYRGQLFDWATILLFFPGIIYAFFLPKRKWFLLTSWFVLVFLGSMLTASPIYLARVVVGLPVIYLFVALGLEAILVIGKKRKKISWTLVGIIMVYAMVANLFTYFIDYPRQQARAIAGDINALNATYISYYLDSLSSSYQAIFLTAPNLYADFATLQFLSPSVRKTNIPIPAQYDTLHNCYLHTAYIIYPQYHDIFTKLQQHCRIEKSFVYSGPAGEVRYYIIQTP